MSENHAPTTIFGSPGTPPLANEKVLDYRPGSPERTSLEAELKRQKGETRVAPLIIDGDEVETGNTFEITAPHDHSQKLADRPRLWARARGRCHPIVARCRPRLGGSPLAGSGRRVLAGG